MIKDEAWEGKVKLLRSMPCLKGFKFTGYRGKKADWSQVASGKQSDKGSETRDSALRREAVIVKAGEDRYSQALKKVREDLAGAGVNVSVIRKTKAGDILVEAKVAAANTGQLREALAGQNTRAVGGLTPVVIKGLDALSTREEVLESVKSVVGDNSPVEYGEMWTTFGDTRAMKVRMSREAAEKVKQVGVINVGPVRCRVQATDKNRCYRCWEEGHMAARCKGPDRRGKCFRCGEDGHTAAECRNDVKCLVCSEKGHRTGAPSCRSSSALERKDVETRDIANFRVSPTHDGKK